MEFPELGKNCTKEDCKELDFLPIICQFCKKPFCSKCFLPADHQCAVYKDKKVDKNEVSNIIEKYYCSVPGCKKYELAPVKCNYCGIQLCLKHRYQQDHGCPKYVAPVKTMTATKAVVDKILSSNGPGASEPKKIRSVKAQKTAAKVQLMKLKMKSSGNKTLPQEERTYFMVTPPKITGKPASGVWVSNKWVMGKVVDTVADLLSVQNFNNVAEKEKLKLFRKTDGQSVCEDMSATLKSVLENEELFNGDNVILEYIANNEYSLE